MIRKYIVKGESGGFREFYEEYDNFTDAVNTYIKMGYYKYPGCGSITVRVYVSKSLRIEEDCNNVSVS